MAKIESAVAVQTKGWVTDRWPIQAVSWLEWGSSIAGRILLWLAEQEVNMLRHDDVPVNLKSETVPHPLQG